MPISEEHMVLNDHVRRMAGPALAVFSTAVVMVIAATIGAQGRMPATGDAAALSVERPAQALDAFASSGARGRVLVVLDERSRVTEYRTIPYTLEADIAPEDIPATADNLVSVLTELGVAREVFVVVPDASWASFEERVSGSPEVLVEPYGYLRRLQGVAIRFLPESRFQRPDEPVLVLANEGLLGTYTSGLPQALADPSASELTVTLAAEGGPW